MSVLAWCVIGGGVVLALLAALLLWAVMVACARANWLIATMATSQDPEEETDATDAIE